MAKDRHLSPRNWTRDETLAAFNLYLRTTFGRLHARNPEINALAAKLGRTPSSVAMKCCNLAALDPSIPQKGLRSTSAMDRQIWDDFLLDPEETGYQSELVFSSAMEAPPREVTADTTSMIVNVANTDRVVVRRVRVTQHLFRDAILASYVSQCAVCRFATPALLVASHIIGWAVDATHRMNPRNGICLCSFHDKAFDSGILDIGEDFILRVTTRHSLDKGHRVAREMMYRFDGKQLHLPERWHPDPGLLRRRRELMGLSR